MGFFRVCQSIACAAGISGERRSYCQIFLVGNYIIDKIIFKAIISLSFRVLLLKLISSLKGSVIVLYD